MSNSSIRGRQASATTPPSEQRPRSAPRREGDEAASVGATSTPAPSTSRLDEPFAYDLVDTDEDTPPLHGKTHPRSELRGAVPTLDDEVRRYHHHPNDAGAIEFEVNPYAADAAADLAGDLGSEFLEGATRGQDLSDVVMSREDREGDLSYLFDDEDAEATADGAAAPDDEEQPPTLRMPPRHPR